MHKPFTFDLLLFPFLSKKYKKCVLNTLYVPVNSVTTPTKLVAKLSHVKRAKSFPQGPSALLVTLNYGLIHNIASRKLIQKVISKLQQHIHIQKQKQKQGKEERKSRNERRKREMRREEVGGRGAVYHTQVTMLGVNHCSIACLACLSI